MVSELSKALVEAQAEMPAVEKTAKANYGMYATLDHLLAKTRPVLNRHGLAVSQFPAVSELGQPTLVTRLVHSSGESVEYAMPLLLPEDKRGMQALGAAITYGRRYALAAALGIASENDDDGAAATSDAPIEANGEKRVTQAQIKRLFAIARDKNVDEETVKYLMRTVAGVESSKEIPADKYDTLIDAVQTGSSFYAPTGAKDDVPF
jgi:hypothetical protein